MPDYTKVGAGCRRVSCSARLDTGSYSRRSVTLPEIDDGWTAQVHALGNLPILNSASAAAFGVTPMFMPAPRSVVSATPSEPPSESSRPATKAELQFPLRGGAKSWFRNELPVGLVTTLNPKFVA
jgi:hypothetical protein